MVAMTLRLTDELHAFLKDSAKAAGRSLQGEIVWRLRATQHGPDVAHWALSGEALKQREADTAAASEPVSPARVVDNRSVSRSSSVCPMVVPRGVKCKACGKVHGALGEGEPSVGVIRQRPSGAFNPGVDVGDTASSPSPSAPDEALAERGQVQPSKGRLPAFPDLPRSASAPSAFKPDPKPGKKP